MSDHLTLKPGMKVYCIGIKGTGVSALAQLLKKSGYIVTGSDTAEKFPTEEVLEKSGIAFYESFDPEHIDEKIDFLVYSVAFNTESNPELKKAARLGLPMFTYPRMLGLLSENIFSAGICGVNGKTSTTAMTASLVDSCRLDASLICGSAITAMGGDPAVHTGNDFFIAETCEYKRGFLNFNPDVIILTNIELDHTDYYRNLEDISSAFAEYIRRLPQGGTVIYCADNEGSAAMAVRMKKERPDIVFIPYGVNAVGDFKIELLKPENGKQRFRLNAFNHDFELNVPGVHNVLNAAGAAALVSVMLGEKGLDIQIYEGHISKGIKNFKGTKRRTEIYGEASGILFIDDYGHHPASIKTTLEGLREFYKGRRIVVDFMSHTYSRTESLLDEFARSFDAADLVVLNKIYASAREKKGNVSGKTLYDLTLKYQPDTVYCHELEDAENYLKGVLKDGDLFITIGAGDNWKICSGLYSHFGGTDEQ